MVEPRGSTGPTISATPQQRALAGLARLVLETPIDGRLPNVADLRELLSVGTGTVQKSLVELQTSAGVVLDSKQRHGTFLRERDFASLWSIAGLAPLRVLLPLPNSWEFQGLASALRAELDAVGVPATSFYAHGSTERAASVKTGVAQVAITSLHAAKRLVAETPSLAIASSLPGGTYYAPNSVLVLARAAREQTGPAPRIGIDSLSDDHTALTHAVFPSANLVPVSYAQIPAALSRNLIDAAVWHRTALGLSLEDQHLTTWDDVADVAEFSPDYGAAALMTGVDDILTTRVLGALDFTRLLERQRNVIDGDVLPLY